MAQVLSGITVLEYGDYVTAAFCTKFLAELGAEVIKIERPIVGDDARRNGPFPNDLPDPERSGLYLCLNTSKLGITLDVDSPAGRRILDALIGKADILVHNLSPKCADALHLSYDNMSKANPSLIVTAVTPFGESGPYRNYKAYPINTAAASGLALFNGEPGREPLIPPLSVGSYMAGATAAMGTMQALLARSQIGRGQFVEVSETECLNNYFSGVAANGFVYYNRRRTRTGHHTRARYPYTVLPCKDGYVWIIAIQGYHWKRFLLIVGDGALPEWSKKPEYREDMWEHADQIEAELGPWMMAHTRQEIQAACRAERVPFAPIRGIDEVLADDHLAARDFFVQTEHPVAGVLTYPGPPFRLSATPSRLRSPAPLLGQHNDEIYCGRLGYSSQDLAAWREAGIV